MVLAILVGFVSDPTEENRMSATFSRRSTEESRWRLTMSVKYPLLIATGEAIPLRGLEGVPGLPGAPQDGHEGAVGWVGNLVPPFFLNPKKERTSCWSLRITNRLMFFA